MNRLLAIWVLVLTVTAARAELPSANLFAANQALASGKPTVLDLGARACIPCKKMAPILEELAGTYRDRANVLFIDVHEEYAAADVFGIQMIPTQIFFDAKGREVSRHLGFMGRDEIIKGLTAAGLK